MEQKTIGIDLLEDALNRWLAGKNYADNTMRSYRSEFRCLKKYLQTVGSNAYSIELGNTYSAERLGNDFKPRTKTEIKRSVAVWNHFLQGAEIPNRRFDHKWKDVPGGFQEVVKSFIADAEARCNKHKTLCEKEYIATSFFNELSTIGCERCSDIQPELILKAILRSKKYTWLVIKRLLSYMYSAGYVNQDYSALVPRNRTPEKLPTSYTKDELLQVESTFDLDNPIGRRDFAIFKVASKEALRSLDIAQLTMKSIDFDGGHISLIQSKGGDELTLPLFPDVKEALLAYINNGRPDCSSEYVFLRERAPYDHLSRQAIYTIISKAFRSSGVDTADKHRGGHSLRSSNATQKINSGMRYAQVQKSLGHRSKEAIRHYARLDINNLRKCAITPPPVDSCSVFGRFLSGDIS